MDKLKIYEKKVQELQNTNIRLNEDNKAMKNINKKLMKEFKPSQIENLEFRGDESDSSEDFAKKMATVIV